MNEVEFYLEDLRSKFSKINPAEYYLSYSGGRDSHLLYWFIKEYLKEPRIEIVSMNTRMEIPMIRRRMMANADRILYPTKSHAEIKENYGIPCFTKQQDQLIYYYQKQSKKGKITKSIYELVIDPNNSDTKFKLNKYAKKLILTGKLHNISDYCRRYFKKNPAKKYEKESGKKPIIGIMGGESLLRKTKINTCFNTKKYFYPIWDLSESLKEEIEQQYDIEVPEIYKHVKQTGCAGCPYGIRRREYQQDLDYCTPNQREFILDYFRESYEVRGAVYQPRLFALSEVM